MCLTCVSMVQAVCRLRQRIDCERGHMDVCVDRLRVSIEGTWRLKGYECDIPFWSLKQADARGSEMFSISPRIVLSVEQLSVDGKSYDGSVEMAFEDAGQRDVALNEIERAVKQYLSRLK